MFWFVYNVLFAVGYLVTFPYYLARMVRRGGYRAGFLQRFAVYPPDLVARIRAQPRIWVHAVSVGEVLVALRFLEEARRRRPGQAFLLSTTTSTGHALAARSLHADDVLIYFPVDFGPVLRRVLGLVKPRAFVLTETELWPCAIHHCRRRGIPVLLLNGRLSGHSFRGYRRFRWFFGRVLRELDLLCMQGQADAQRVLELGADPARVHAVGSVKFDVAQADPESARKASDVLRAAGFGDGDPVIVGGSTWEGEEAALLEAFRTLRVRFPALRLVLVPRHVERTPQVMPEIEKRGLRFVRRSALRDGPAQSPGSRDVLLVDTTGELRHFYARATAIFVGKSLTQTGGQNPIEPAVYGRPIVVGPHMENFAEIVPEFLAADAMVQVRDAAGLTAELERFLADPARRDAVGQRAAAVVERQRGAFLKTLDLAAAKWPEVF
jgi:3-deoxy-D-manno-octulosonic-acid transferase